MTIKKDRPLVSFDWAAKKILRDKANFDILEGFLATLLKQEIKIISILESESTPEHQTDKFNKVDLLVENQRGELIIIEVQNNREVHYLERLLYGTSKLIVDHLQLGESYEKVKKVISISILYFLLGEGETDYVYHGSTAFYGLHDGSKLMLRHHKREALVDGYIDIGTNIFPEYYLIEVERFQDIIKSDLDEWIYFFKNSEIKENFKAKNIQRAKEKLDLLKMPENERKAYERYLMNKASEKDVIETAKMDGKTEGKSERTIEIAKAMLAEGIQASLISKVTGLSEEEILQLK
jgi:hypothetical protein